MKNEFLKQISTYFPSVDYCSFRFVNKYTNIVSVTRNVLEPIEILEDEGVMVTIIHNGGYGYGASSDLTREGILKSYRGSKKVGRVFIRKISTCATSTLYENRRW